MPHFPRQFAVVPHFVPAVCRYAAFPPAVCRYAAFPPAVCPYAVFPPGSLPLCRISSRQFAVTPHFPRQFAVMPHFPRQFALMPYFLPAVCRCAGAGIPSPRRPPSVRQRLFARRETPPCHPAPSVSPNSLSICPFRPQRSAAPPSGPLLSGSPVAALAGRRQQPIAIPYNNYPILSVDRIAVSRYHSRK